MWVRYKAAKRCTWKRTQGQSLIEITLTLPVMLLVMLNAVNLGYFYLVVLNLGAAARNATEYSIQGYDSNAAAALPPAGPSTSASSVSYLAYQDLTGALNAPSSAALSVCTMGNGTSGAGATQTSNCSSYGTATFPATPSDPEAPSFVLNRVAISYTFSPLIPGTPFGLALLPSGACTSASLTMTCTFQAQAVMRAMD
jgi:Flp pilus assembly protein TadG